jgi:DNA-binding SARP family transcriptional activator/Tfp pilus assembly protein PilF
MRFRVLGPMRVWDGGAWSAIGAAHQRVVLAVLLAEAGRTVSTERLVHEIWGEHPPRTAVHAVQVYVRRLRQLLGHGPPGPLTTRGRGYQLTIDDADVDAAGFGGLVDAAGRSLAGGELETAVAQLSQALALWRGPAFADVPAGPTVTAEAARLDQRRLTAVEERLGALLDLGRHAEVVDDLPGLVDEQPLRERLHTHLMVALYRCGRRSDALAAYQRARAVFVAELGLEPSTELRELQRAILADSAALAAPARADGRASAAAARTWPVPAQLPADVAGFHGRTGHLGKLDTLLRAAHDPAPALAFAAITGPAGVGKTALAVHWAHRVAAHFPDGQLYVNLRGYSAGPPLRPIDALAGLLPDLGLPADQIPSDVERAAAAYRSLLAGRRVLVLLDNARRADQVRPLLPGGPGCLALVTSRDRLPGLVARNGAVQLGLEVLTPDEAQALLTDLLGAERVDAEPAAAAELAGLCGRLPLALRIAAAHLTTRPRTGVGAYVRTLAGGDRLTALEIDGDPDACVRTAFDRSYRGLPDPARRLFRLLGLAPGPDITAPAAAALAGPGAGAASGEERSDGGEAAPQGPRGPRERSERQCYSTDEARALLDRLTSTHLVDEPATGRYALHDLLRLYAAERAIAEDGEPDRRAALDRLYDFQLAGVDAAAGRLYPQILRLAGRTARVAHTFDDDASASAWLDAERANLVAATRESAATGSFQVAWRLADALRGYLYLGMHVVDWQAVAQVGLRAAEAYGDPAGQAAARISLALLHLAQGRPTQAIGEYTRALALARESSWIEGQSATLGNLGAVFTNLGRFTEAAEYCTQALALDERTGWRVGQATKLGNLGIVYFGLGRLARAADHQTRSLALFQEADARSGEARTLANLGEVRHALGYLDEAAELLTRALATHRELADRHSEGDTTRALAAVNLDAGRHDAAGDLAGTAVDLARRSGDRRLEAAALATRARVQQHTGDVRGAIDGYREALRIARDTGDRYIEADTLTGLTAASRMAGDLDEAAGHARDALHRTGQGEYRVIEGRILTELAALHLDRSAPERAFADAERALLVHAESGHRLGQAHAHLVAGAALSDLRDGRRARLHRDRAGALLAEIGAPGPDPLARRRLIVD